MNSNQVKIFFGVLISILLGTSSHLVAQDSYQVYRHVTSISNGDKFQISHPVPEAGAEYEVNVELLYTKNRHTDVLGLAFTSDLTYNVKSVDQTETIATSDTLGIHFTSGDTSLERSKRRYQALSNEVELEIVTIANSVDVPEDVEIRLSITKVNGPNYTFPAGNSLVDFVDYRSDKKILYCAYKEHVKEYEFEWVFIDELTNKSLTPDHLTANLGAQEAFNLYQGISIRTPETYYPFDPILPRGKVYFRARYILDHPDYESEIAGPWRYLTKNGIVPSLTVDENSSFEENKIWSYQRTYAEGGKEKTVVTFADALGNTRQLKTEINSDNNIVVAETLYDYEGRASTSVMPFPMERGNVGNKHALSYLANANVYEDGTKNKSHYDKSSGSDPLSTIKGAAKYFSAQNDLKSMHRDYIPDAGGYVTSQVHYKKDHTGRPTEASGVGKTFAMGQESTESHTSKTFYLQPTQIELASLFGDQVGEASRYRKQVSIDANHQASVTYTDMAGRVIATGLMGQSPDNLQALESNVSKENIEILNSKKTLDNQSVINHKILNTGVQKIDFTYTFKGANSELKENICYKCQYDLSIYLVAPSGEEITISHEEVPGQPLVDKARIIKTYTSEDILSCTEWNKDIIKFSATLTETGEHNIVKKLTPREFELSETVEGLTGDSTSAADLLGTDFLSLDDITTEMIAKEDFSVCLPCHEQCKQAVLEKLNITEAQIPMTSNYEEELAKCKEDRCNVGRWQSVLQDRDCEGLLDDMAEQFEQKGVYYPINVLSPSGEQIGGQGVTMIDFGAPLTTTMEAIILEERALLPEGELLVFQNETGVAFQDEFWSRTGEFSSDWATTLALKHHPEIAHYQFCRFKQDEKVLNSAVGEEYSLNSYELAMNNTSTFDEALAKGFLDPLLYNTAKKFVLSGSPDLVESSTDIKYEEYLLQEEGLTGTSIIDNPDPVFGLSNSNFNYTDGRYSKLTTCNGLDVNDLVDAKNKFINYGSTLEPTITDGSSSTVTIQATPTGTSFPIDRLSIWEFHEHMHLLDASLDPLDKDEQWREFRTTYLTQRDEVINKLKNCVQLSVLNAPHAVVKSIESYSDLSLEDIKAQVETQKNAIDALSVTYAAEEFVKNHLETCEDFLLLNDESDFGSLNYNTLQQDRIDDLSVEIEKYFISTIDDNYFHLVQAEDLGVHPDLIAAEAVLTNYGLTSCPLSHSANVSAYKEVCETVNVDKNLFPLITEIMNDIHNHLKNETIGSYIDLNATDNFSVALKQKIDEAGITNLTNFIQSEASINCTGCLNYIHKTDINFVGSKILENVGVSSSNEFIGASYVDMFNISLTGMTNNYSLNAIQFDPLKTTKIYVNSDLGNDLLIDIYKYFKNNQGVILDFTDVNNAFAQEIKSKAESLNFYFENGKPFTYYNMEMVSDPNDATKNIKLIGGVAPYDYLFEGDVYINDNGTTPIENFYFVHIPFGGSGGIFRTYLISDEEGQSLLHGVTASTYTTQLRQPMYLASTSSTECYKVINDDCGCVQDVFSAFPLTYEGSSVENMNFEALSIEDNASNILVTLNDFYSKFHNPNIGSFYYIFDKEVVDQELLNLIGSTQIFYAPFTVEKYVISGNGARQFAFKADKVNNEIKVVTYNIITGNYQESLDGPHNLRHIFIPEDRLGVKTINLRDINPSPNCPNCPYLSDGEFMVNYHYDTLSGGFPNIVSGRIEIAEYTTPYIVVSSCSNQGYQSIQTVSATSNELRVTKDQGFFDLSLYKEEIDLQGGSTWSLLDPRTIVETSPIFETNTSPVVGATGYYTGKGLDVEYVATSGDTLETSVYLYASEENEPFFNSCYFQTPEITEVEITPEQCIAEIEAKVEELAKVEFETIIDSAVEKSIDKVTSQCLDGIEESFTFNQIDNQYHFTLYYYDQAGNLVQTVPPAGVERLDLDSTDFETRENALGEKTLWYKGENPDHNLATRYHYNSVGNMITSHTPDGGDMQYWYDSKFRIRLSQNAQQVQESIEISGNNQYAYTKYDELGRPVESGELLNLEQSYVTVLNRSITVTSPENLTEQRSDQEAVHALLDQTNFPDLNDNEIAYNIKEITQTFYTNSFDVGDLPNTSGITQNNLRNRVSSAITKDSREGDTLSAMIYSYDIHGNVNNYWSYVDGLGASQVEYDYDLISGNVLKVAYQEGQVEQFFHKYSYDADNRLTAVKTSTDDGYYQEDAHYYYYAHGPLARVEIGDQGVQGCDYYYNLQGWLKGMNTPDKLGADSTTKTDLGYDGLTSFTGDHSNQYIAKDEFAFALAYFKGDYKSIGGTNLGAANQNILGENSLGAGLYDSDETPGKVQGLYNGNIASMIHQVHRLGELKNDEDPQQAGSYGVDFGMRAQVFTYDQLNRIITTRSHENYTGGGIWTPRAEGSTASYDVNYSYDANGNIKTLKRWGKDENIAIDDLTYSYETANGKLLKNRLLSVHDIAGRKEAGDLRTNAGAYEYDSIGNLVSDGDLLNGDAEGLIVHWRLDGKVESISASNRSIQFKYDAVGNRVRKHVVNTSGNKVGYYIKDASGNTMANYESYKGHASGNYAYFDAIERPIYGSSRVGLNKEKVQVRDLTNTEIVISQTVTEVRSYYVGDKQYELSNHLGNVMVVITDIKQRVTPAQAGVSYYQAQIVSANDYYPFGWTIADRSYTSESYRYGFNGMEKDDEVKGDGDHYDLGFRHYDPRLARMFSIDPLASIYPFWSPYQYSANSPIDIVDYLGLGPEDWIKEEGTSEWVWDDEVNSDFEAKVKYGNGTVYARPGHIYTSYTGYNVELLDDGEWEWTQLETTGNQFIGDEDWFGRMNRMNAEDEAMMQALSDMGSTLLTWETYDAMAEDMYQGFNSEGLTTVIGMVENAVEMEQAYSNARGPEKYYIGTQIGTTGLIMFFAGTKGKFKLGRFGRKVLCFTEGTLVATDSGFVKIEDIDIGDSVWAYDEYSESVSLKPVTRTFSNLSHHLRVIVTVNDTIYTTDHHPFNTGNEWVDAENLKEGDSLRTFDSFITVKKSYRKDTLVKVFNFEVKEYHSYFISKDKILVHNECGVEFTKRAARMYKKLDPTTKNGVDKALEILKTGNQRKGGQHSLQHDLKGKYAIDVKTPGGKRGKMRVVFERVYDASHNVKKVIINSIEDYHL